MSVQLHPSARAAATAPRRYDSAASAALTARATSWKDWYGDPGYFVTATAIARPSGPFHQHGDALADADAQRGQPAAAALALRPSDQDDQDPGTGEAQRVT